MPVDQTLLQRLLEDKYWDVNFQASLSEIIPKVLSQKGIMYTAKKGTKTFQDFVCTVKNDKQLFDLCVQRTFKDEDTARKFFEANQIFNDLRVKIPNFTYVYYQGKENRKNIYMEHVKGETLDVFTKRFVTDGGDSVMKDKLVSVITQVAMAVENAFRNGITIKNLHPRNVVLRPVTDKVSIEYVIDKEIGEIGLRERLGLKTRIDTQTVYVPTYGIIATILFDPEQRGTINECKLLDTTYLLQDPSMYMLKSGYVFYPFLLALYKIIIVEQTRLKKVAAIMEVRDCSTFTMRGPKPIIDPLKDKPYDKLREVQADAVQRFANRCNQQRGHLVVHSMGSGKTLIGLAYLANFSSSIKKVVIVPAGIDAAWKKDMVDFWFTPDFQCHVDFITYDELNSASALKLQDLFTDAVVTADEAHILVKTLRGPNRANVRRALLDVKHILLLTGTPVQSGWGDLGVLINVCQGEPLLPGTDERFRQEFKLSKSVSQMTKSILGWIDIFNSFIYKASSSYYYYAATVFGALSYLPVLNEYAASVSNAIPMWLVTTIFFATVVSSKAIDTIVKKYETVDPLDVAKRLQNFVSYFDYNRRYPLPHMPELVDFPAVYSGKPIIKTFEMTDFQKAQFVMNSHPLNLQSSEELDIFNDVDFDELAEEGGKYKRSVPDWTDASVVEKIDISEDYVSRMRALGNLSPLALYYEPVRQMPENVSPKVTILPNLKDEFDTAVRQGSPSTLNYAGNMPYVARERSTTYRKYLETNMDKIWEKNQIQMANVLREKFNLPPVSLEKLVTSSYMFSTPKFEGVVELCLNARTQHHFLPVVYSNFEKNGLAQLSAYLTAKKLPHIIIHPNDAEDIRKRLINIANLPHRRYAVNRDPQSDRVAVPLETAGDLKVNYYLNKIIDEMDRGKKIDDDHYSKLCAEFKSRMKLMSVETNEDQRLKLFAEAAKNEQQIRQIEKKFGAVGKTPVYSPDTFDEAVTNYGYNQKTMLGVTDNKSYRRVYEIKHGTPDAQKMINVKETEERRLLELLKIVYNGSEQYITGTQFVDSTGQTRYWSPFVDEVPFCVLLHPGIREGIGFELAPCMIALEVPTGVGNRDQIYARVLRSTNSWKRLAAFIDNTLLPGTESVTEQKLQTREVKELLYRGTPFTPRITKKIYQFVLGYGITEYNTPPSVRAVLQSMNLDIPSRIVGFNIVYPSADEVSRIVSQKSLAEAKRRDPVVAVSDWIKMKAAETLVDLVIDKKPKEIEKIAEDEIKDIIYSRGVEVVPESLSYYQQVILMSSFQGRLFNITAPIRFFNKNLLRVGLEYVSTWLTDRGNFKIAQARGMEWSYERWIQTAKHYTTMTADEITFSMNAASSDELDAMNDALNSIQDKTVQCADPIESQPSFCQIWYPDSIETQTAHAKNKDSCISKNDLSSTGTLFDASIISALISANNSPNLGEVKLSKEYLLSRKTYIEGECSQKLALTPALTILSKFVKPEKYFPSKKPSFTTIVGCNELQAHHKCEVKPAKYLNMVLMRTPQEVEQGIQFDTEV
jgi:hypothetical protein